MMRIIMMLLMSLLVTLGAENFAYAASDNAFAVHKKAWGRIVNSKDPSIKYAIYANRIISVKHPEIYLKSDLEMLKEISALHPEIISEFSWDNLKKIELLGEKDVYPAEAPFYNFLDRRVMPPTATLIRQRGGKTVIQTKMTSLEKSILAYYVMQKSQKKSDMVILYCASGDAYLIANKKAISMKDMGEYEIENITCKPILVFNEKDSWFPIMKKQAKLPAIIDVGKMLGGAFNLASTLIAEERDFIDKLSSKTRLDGKEVELAELLAQKRGPVVTVDYEYGTDKDILAKWREVFNYGEADEYNIDRVHTGASHLIMQYANLIGNQISPLAAYLADTSDCSSDLGNCLIKKYKKYFGWYLLWNWGLTSFSIDEAYSSGGGGVCAEQSTYMASILELIGVDYFALHLTGYNSEGRKKDHRIIYVPEWNVTFSNNQMFKGYKEPNGYKGLVYIYNDDKWMFFADSVMFGNGKSGGAEKLFKNFLEMSRRNDLVKEFACRPFTNEADFESCEEIGKPLNQSVYKTISLILYSPLRYQTLLIS